MFNFFLSQSHMTSVYFQIKPEYYNAKVTEHFSVHLLISITICMIRQALENLGYLLHYVSLHRHESRNKRRTILAGKPIQDYAKIMVGARNTKKKTVHLLIISMLNLSETFNLNYINIQKKIRHTFSTTNS